LKSKVIKKFAESFLISLSEELKSKGKETKRTIIYSTSLERIGLYFESMGILLKDMLQDDDEDLYGMYCSATRDDVKVKYLKSLQEENGTLRVIFASSAFGMGVDAKGITTIIHDSCPESIDEYVQETGRSGREGQKSNAILLNKTSRFTNEKMKEYLQNKECRRDFLLKHYGFDRIETDGDCCDNCSNKKK